MSCRDYRKVKLLEHTLDVMERVLKRTIRAMVNLDEIQFGFMPGKGTDVFFFYFKEESGRAL